MSEPEPSNPSSSIYGVDEADLEKLQHPFATLADTPEQWRSIFDRSLGFIRSFLTVRDSASVIAKCVNQAMASAAARKEDPRWMEGSYEPFMLIEPAELEFVQALALMQVSACKVPASPGSLSRLLPEIPKCTYAFLRMQPGRYPDAPEREQLIGKIRLQTMFHRNLFVREDCETVVRAILQQVDDVATQEWGVPFSEVFSALVTLTARIEQRSNAYHDRVRDGFGAETEADARKTIEFFCSISPTAKRAWSKCKKHCSTLDSFRFAAFQLSEICHAWPYVLKKTELRSSFGQAIVSFFERLAIRSGELAAANPEHFLMNNPVWRRPFILLDEDTLFLPLPSLIYGFPFQIFEQFIEGRPSLEQAYSSARSKMLESMVETHISTAMPSAKTFQRVMWRDEAGTLYENDVVALIGNTIFLFEAKSGKLDDVARRGGELSLLRNFKKLFVEPGEQACRLENYLNTKGEGARLWIKDTGEVVHLDLDRPKVVHKFSICIEHFAALTSAKHNLKVLGAIKDEKAWAPVLSLGELMLVWRYLDTEISFFHYLTRRATLEEVVDFEGDEQDILSMYLINGLFIDPKKIKGRQVRFLNIDGLVRTGKIPRLDRTEFEVFGIPLDSYWRSTLKEIYSDASLGHRFDILQVILNQDPYALAGVMRQVQKYKRGLISGNRGDLLLTQSKIGERVFVLAYSLVKHPITGEEWTERSRTIAHNAAAAIFSASDCAVLLRVKKSKSTTYDGISFHRLMTAPGK